MARIRKYDHFPKELKQSNQDGCIPTNIAAVLQSYGKEWITEQEVTRACLSVIPDKGNWSFESLRRLNVLSRLRPENKEQGLDDSFVLHTRGFETFDEWWTQITHWIDSPYGWPVLISYTRDDGSVHACTAIGVDSEKLEIYDPSPGVSNIPTAKSDLEMAWSSTRPRLNHDVMTIALRVPFDILQRAHAAQLKKMLGLIALWSSLFVGLVAMLIALIARSPPLFIRLPFSAIAVALTVGNISLTMAILGKFQELVFLEKQPGIDLASFYTYLRDHNIPFKGARIWDWIVRKLVLRISDKELSQPTPYDLPAYQRMNLGLNVVMVACWVLTLCLLLSILLILFR